MKFMKRKEEAQEISEKENHKWKVDEESIEKIAKDYGKNVRDK